MTAETQPWNTSTPRCTIAQANGLRRPPELIVAHAVDEQVDAAVDGEQEVWDGDEEADEGGDAVAEARVHAECDLVEEKDLRVEALCTNILGI